MGLRYNFFREGENEGRLMKRYFVYFFMPALLHVDAFWGFLIDFKVTRSHLRDPDVS